MPRPIILKGQISKHCKLSTSLGLCENARTNMSSHPYHLIVTWFGISSVIKYFPCIHSGQNFVSSVLATAEWGVAIWVRFPVTRWELIGNALGMFVRCYFGRKYLILSEWTLECVTIRTVPRGLDVTEEVCPGWLPQSERPGLLAPSLSFLSHVSCETSEGRRFWLQYLVWFNLNAFFRKPLGRVQGTVWEEGERRRRRLR